MVEPVIRGSQPSDWSAGARRTFVSQNSTWFYFSQSKITQSCPLWRPFQQQLHKDFGGKLKTTSGAYAARFACHHVDLYTLSHYRRPTTDLYVVGRENPRKYTLGFSFHP